MTESELQNRAPARFKALQFIRSEIYQTNRFPSRDAITFHLGWKESSSVNQVLTELVVDGFLERERSGNTRQKYVYRLKRRGS